jgi:hypothetical protein
MPRRFKYDIFHSEDTKNRKRKWSKVPTGSVILELPNACIAAAESVAAQNGLASRGEFATPLNSSYCYSANGRSAKVVLVGEDFGQPL